MASKVRSRQRAIASRAGGHRLDGVAGRREGVDQRLRSRGSSSMTSTAAPARRLADGRAVAARSRRAARQDARRTVLPWPGVLRTPTRPPCASTSRFGQRQAQARCPRAAWPRPRRAAGTRRTAGCRSSRRMPMPVSSTSSRKRVGALRP